MNSSAASAWTLLACGSVGLLAHERANAAEWLVAPQGRVAADYTDNPRLLLTGGQNDAGVMAEADAVIRRRSERTEFSLQPRWVSTRYKDDGTLDSDNQYLAASMQRSAERSQWAASLNLVRDSTLTSEAGSTGIVQSNRRHEGITVSAGPTFALTERISAGAQLYWMGNHYVDAGLTGLVDYDYGAASLFTGFTWTERSTITVTAQLGRLTVDEQPGSTRDATLRVAWKYQMDSLWDMQLSAGPAFVDTGFGDDSGTVFAFDVSRRVERWSFTAMMGRDLAPTGRGVLTKRDQVVITGQRRLTDRLSTGLSLRWVSNQDLLSQPHVAFQRVTYGRLDLRADWRLAEQWSVGLAVGTAAQEYDSTPGRAQNYRALLSLIWNGQAQNL